MYLTESYAWLPQPAAATESASPSHMEVSSRNLCRVRIPHTRLSKGNTSTSPGAKYRTLACDICHSLQSHPNAASVTSLKEVTCSCTRRRLMPLERSPETSYPTLHDLRKLFGIGLVATFHLNCHTNNM